MMPPEVLMKGERVEFLLKPDLIATFLPASLMAVLIMLVTPYGSLRRGTPR